MVTQVDFEGVVRWAKAKWPDGHPGWSSWAGYEDNGGNWAFHLSSIWNAKHLSAFRAEYEKTVADEVPGCPGATWQDVVDYVKKETGILYTTGDVKKGVMVKHWDKTLHNFQDRWAVRELPPKEIYKEFDAKKHVEPWCCPVCLRSDRPKAKDVAMCERCRPCKCPSTMNTGSPSYDDFLKTDEVWKRESAQKAKKQILWAMSLQREGPRCCNRNMVWPGYWLPVHGRTVEVTILCSMCRKTEKQRLEVRER